MKLIFATDPHFQSRYMNRVDDVQATFQRKVLEIFDLAKRHDAKAIIWGGDIFHNKNPQKTSHRFVKKLMEIFSIAPVPMYTNIGNHDIQYNDVRTIHRQPLGVLFASDLIKYLGPNMITLGDQVQIMGLDYGTDIAKVKPVKTSLQRIAVLHTFLDKKPGDFYGEKVWGFDELKHLGATYILNGHDHSAFPIEKHKGMIIARPGSLFRNAMAKSDIERPIQVAMIDTDAKSIEYVQLEYEPAEKVFDLTKKARLFQETTEIDKFIAKINESVNFEKKTLDNELAAIEMEPYVREVVQNYLSNAKEAE